MERNLYRICILFSNPNKILFKSNIFIHIPISHGEGYKLF